MSKPAPPNQAEAHPAASAEHGDAFSRATHELTKAYQDLAARNAKNLSDAMKSLASVKTPAEFIELQQKLIKQGVEAAVADSRHIATLTTTVFTTAFEPVKHRIAAVKSAVTPP
ncbi:phasin family protein [Acidiphilium sp.]|uniref:phasin family protein n=1 Tax=Acidiphilium sp. TaxID=527 RepID=UPI003CFEC8AC